MVKSRIAKNRKAQTSLETTLALAGALLLMFGALKVFTWLAGTMVLRQQDYEATRVEAGSIDMGADGAYLDETSYPPLDIVGDY